MKRAVSNHLQNISLQFHFENTQRSTCLHKGTEHSSYYGGFAHEDINALNREHTYLYTTTHFTVDHNVLMQKVSTVYIYAILLFNSESFNRYN